MYEKKLEETTYLPCLQSLKAILKSLVPGFSGVLVYALVT